MNIRHKHAEVLIAIAEGIPVQFLNPKVTSGWEDWDIGFWNPLNGVPMQNGWKWRIKPNPVKKYKVAYAIGDGGHAYEYISGSYFKSLEEFKALFCHNALWAVLLEPTMIEGEE